MSASLDKLEGVKLRCVSCGSVYPGDPKLFRCPRCGGILEVIYDRLSVSRGPGRGVWRYSGALPRLPRVVTLDEGGTPLPRLDSVSRATGLEVYGKLEAANPTGSFKDRGMSVGVSVALSVGARIVVAASTGNTAASMAAYASRAGLKPVVLLPKGAVAKGKLAQALAYGARVVSVRGNFDKALAIARRLVDEGLAYPLNSFNPYRLEGQKTIAFEVIEDIGVPDYVVVPVGNAGNIAAIWKGFKEAYSSGVIERLPVMIGVQARGANPLEEALVTGVYRPVSKPETIASAIRIGDPVNREKALKAVRESGGTIISVTDDEIIEAGRLLAREEGLLVEPASAASVAGLLKLAREGRLTRGATVVAVLTGHGLKDPDFLALVSGDEGVVEVEDEEGAARVLRAIAEE